MKCHWLRDQRGSVLLFTTVLIVFLLVMGGIAIDLTYLGAAKGELQRSMDAASLAGAGNLGFDDTVFPTVRQEAWRFGDLNPYRVGTVNLNLNAANAANGDIVLGIWDSNAGTFTPSLDGTRVNAVQCQYATQIPTSFLRLLGFNTLPVAATATAVADPPLTVDEETCVFPIALSGCPFQDAGGNTSEGCGQPVTLISSSGSLPGPPPGTNTAAWANLCSTSTPSTPVTIAAIEAAGDPDQACNSCTPDNGEPIGTNNGMQQPVFNALEEQFMLQYDPNVFHEITDSGGSPTYNGPGWKVAVPVIGTDCPPQAIAGTHDIIGWTEFVMTQVVNHGTCAVNNPYDPQLTSLGCMDTGEPAYRAVFGYYNCTLIDAPPDNGGPRSALATRLRLVR